MPVGSWLWWPVKGNVPDGCLPCDGRAVERLTHAELFQVIGTTYGAGDGKTTFNVPVQAMALGMQLVVTHARLVPTGALMVFAGSQVPAGLLCCDGGAVLRATYPAL